MTLRNKFAKGVSWLTAAKVGSRLLELLKIFILARLLTPDQFGLFGLGMLVVLMTEYLSQTGINTALVKQKNLSQADLDTAWFIQIVRGLVLGSLIFVSAPLFAIFFHEPELDLFLRVMSIVPVLQGFINIGIVYFEKNFQFHKVFSYEVGSTFFSVLVALSLGYFYRSAWALLWSNVALVLFRLLYSYVASPVRPRLKFQRERAIELFHFGKWISGQSSLMFLTQQVDKIVIGSIVGAHALGIYQIAQRIAEFAVANLASVATKVSFPAYVELGESHSEISVLCLDILEVLLCILLPLNIFLVIFAPELVSLLLGAGWQETVTVIRLLAISATFVILEHTSAPIFLAFGFPKFEFLKCLVKASILATIIYPLTLTYGAKGAALAILIASSSILPFWMKSIALAEVNTRDLIRVLSQVFVHCIATATAILFVCSFEIESELWLITTAVGMCLLFWMLTSMTQLVFAHNGVLRHFRLEIKG